MKRRILYPALLLIFMALVVFMVLYLFILPGDSDLGAAVFFMSLVGLIAFIYVLIFIIYEIKHKNLGQNILIKTNLIYKIIIFLIILVNIVYVPIYLLLLEFNRSKYYVFDIAAWLLAWLFVLGVLHFHKKLINKNLLKGHYFNIVTTVLMMASIATCIGLIDQEWQQTLRHERRNLAFKTTYAENDLAKCVRLTDNAEQCVLYFLHESKNPAICKGDFISTCVRYFSRGSKNSATCDEYLSYNSDFIDINSLISACGWPN